MPAFWVLQKCVWVILATIDYFNLHAALNPSVTNPMIYGARHSPIACDPISWNASADALLVGSTTYYKKRKPIKFELQLVGYRNLSEKSVDN